MGEISIPSETGKKLNEVLKRGANNFDIMRLVASIAVIIGHSYAISPQPPYQDGVLKLLHFDYSGSLAIKFFFFLSGLLVTNSIIQISDPLNFMVKRALRIFPGLFVCLLIAVFIVGPIFTTLPLRSYFGSAETWKYLFKNSALLEIQWRLPGVFSESNLSINGSLWTLPYEVLCYLYLAIFYGLGLLKNKIISNLFFITVIAVSFIFPTYLPTFFSQNPESFLLPGCFAIGALFAINKSSININLTYFVLVWLLVLLSKNSVAYQFLFYIALFYSIVFISSLSFVINHVKVPFDASYGVYVYGFMIQQCINAVLPNIGVHMHQVISSVIAVLLGILSWHFVEKKFIKYGNTLARVNPLLFVKEKVASFKKVPSPILMARSNRYSGVILFLSLSILAALVHAVTLKFVFPGYYSPLVPQHSDFYVPAALSNSSQPYYSFQSLLTWPRPLHMIFMKFTGFFGIYGSVACTIAIVCMNVAMSALIVKRIFNIKLNWLFFTAFLLYGFLLFSHPYFYIFYAQDIGSQLSYLFLLLGALGFYKFYNKSLILASCILFCCSLLAFLSKETYGLVALFFAFLWLLYAFKASKPNAVMPFVCIALAFVLAFVFNIQVKSIFVDPGATTSSDYHISLNPVVIFKEWLIYATESLNILNLLLILFVAFACYKYKGMLRKEMLLFITGSVIGVALAWVPNAVLPNHHYKGYSFNGAYVYYLPLLLLPLLVKTYRFKNISIITAVALSLLSPVFNISKYKDGNNTWVLIQENTQRNLLSALKPLIQNIGYSKQPQKILIQGITFPFHPFAFPESLRSFSNAEFASFDIVNHNPSFVNNKRNDLVMFISPGDTNLVEYDQKWVFNEEGRLVTTINLFAERIFSGQKQEKSVVQVNQENLLQFAKKGFYSPENGISWTNGDALISFDSAIVAEDTIAVKLSTYMPPISKEVVPQLKLKDKDGKVVHSKISTRTNDDFYYLFVLDKPSMLSDIMISSQTVDASPDQRTLSFPFISLELKTY